MNDNLVPVCIEDLVRNLSDKSLKPYIRDNYRITLLNIRDYCDRALRQYDGKDLLRSKDAKR